jgi:nucleoside-diphosphate-sugar epimerase
MQKGDLVLITSISGYLASWIAKQLLEEGYHVRGTVRSIKNSEQQKKLTEILPGAEYVEADLRSEAGWEAAVKDVKWVFHVASPQAVAKEKDRTGGALSGTGYIMNAALKSNSVQKIVVTSSEAAIAYAHPSSQVHFSEDDWTMTRKKSADYFKSKTLAERLFWDLAKDGTLNTRNVAVSTVNPGLILDPR